MADSDIVIIDQVFYFIKIKDFINNTERIISKKITLDNYITHFSNIYNHLNINNKYTLFSNNDVCDITGTEEVIVKGYLFNTTTIVTKQFYQLTLIKIDNELSDIFTQTESQTEAETETQTEAETETQTEAETQIEANYLCCCKCCCCSCNEMPQLEFINEEYDDKSEGSECSEYSEKCCITDYYNYDFKNYDSWNQLYQYQPLQSTEQYTDDQLYHQPLQSTEQYIDGQLKLYQYQPTIEQCKPYYNDVIDELKIKINQPNLGLNFCYDSDITTKRIV
jgi:hypothetical protein